MNAKSLTSNVKLIWPEIEHWVFVKKKLSVLFEAKTNNEINSLYRELNFTKTIVSLDDSEWVLQWWVFLHICLSKESYWLMNVYRILSVFVTYQYVIQNNNEFWIVIFMNPGLRYAKHCWIWPTVYQMSSKKSKKTLSHFWTFFARSFYKSCFSH